MLNLAGNQQSCVVCEKNQQLFCLKGKHMTLTPVFRYAHAIPRLNLFRNQQKIIIMILKNWAYLTIGF